MEDLCPHLDSRAQVAMQSYVWLLFFIFFLGSWVDGVLCCCPVVFHLSETFYDLSYRLYASAFSCLPYFLLYFIYILVYGG